MPAWTEEEVLAQGCKYLDEQARERTRVAGELHQALGGFVLGGLGETTDLRLMTNPLELKTKRVGRIKGVAPAAERSYDNRVYHSKAEMMAAMQLDFQLKAGLIRRWTPQVPYPIIVNAIKICNVVVDFEVEHLDYTIEVIEIKGFQTELYRLKVKLLKACFPALKYSVVAV